MALAMQQVPTTRSGRAPCSAFGGPADSEVGRYRRHETLTREPAQSRRHRSAILILALALCSGCGYSQGQLLYMMGFGQGREAEAEFKLTREGPVLILVDDFEERLDSPRTRTVLANLLARELEANQAVKEVVPRHRLEELRRRHEDFEERGGREIGEMAGAHQVLWLCVQDFSASPQIEETSAAARMAVTVKVLNVLEKKDKTKVRLWPLQHDGRLVSVDLDANVVVKAKTPEAISKLLAAKLAEKVAKLLYEYPLDDFE